MTETTGTTPQALSARYDAWNRLALITNGTQKVIENVYDARGYRIRKDTYTSGTLAEARHYYYTPGWQCVEERIGTTATAERQFVWGLRYIDDLILRDRSTANNGSMNERRYAMQDGNWNMIAICDITGSVGERYAYSAYGSPVFMNGSGTLQSASAIGFETLYAGYRWDGATPQMYYVRNRFLLPQLGTWNKRDPLGYVDGMSFYRCYFVVNATDPSGLWFGDGQSHHWIDRPHVGNLADLCGNLLEAAVLTAEVFRDMLTTWVPGGFGIGDPHYDIHNPIDDFTYREKLDDIFRESENCCEAMIRLRTLIQNTWRELTLGEGAQGPVNPRFEWYPSSPFCPSRYIDTTEILDLFADFACRNQPMPRRVPVLEPVPVPTPVTVPVLPPIPVNNPFGLPDPVDVGVAAGGASIIWAIWEVTRNFGGRACNTGCGVFMMFTPPEYRFRNGNPFEEPPMI